jgi:hypothetical protein
MRDAFVKAAPRLVVESHNREVALAEEAMAVKARIDAADAVVYSTLVENVPGQGRDKAFRQNLGRSIYNQTKYRVWQMVRQNPIALEKLLAAVKFFWAGPEAHRYACDLLTGKTVIEIKTVSLQGLSASQILARVKELTGQDLGINPKSKTRVVTKAVAVLTAYGVIIK